MQSLTVLSALLNSFLLNTNTSTHINTNIDTKQVNALHPPLVLANVNGCIDSIDLTQVPSNSNQFYRCSNGYLNILNCPEGLEFDNSIKSCDWPNAVGVSTSTSTTSSSTISRTSSVSTDSTQVPTDPTSIASTSSLPITITNSATTSTETPIVPDTDIIDSNQEPDLTTPVVPENSSPASSVEYTECNVALDDLSGVPGKCNQFFRCQNGVKLTLSCPIGLVFDNSMKICNWPQNVPDGC